MATTEQDDHILLGNDTSTESKEIKKFVGVWLGVFFVASFLAWARGFGIERFLEDFIAVTFIIFATSKFAHLENFIQSFQSFDVVARRFPLWGYFVPFVEGTLAVAYLLFDKSMLLNIGTVFYVILTSYGLIRELSNQSNLMTSWLGKYIKLPLSKVLLVQYTVIGLVLFLLFIV